MNSIIDTATQHAQYTVNLGDLPTWLAVIGAFSAAWIAGRQLGAQRKDIVRQVFQLERQQANLVDFTWCQRPSCGPRWWPGNSPHPSG